MSNKPDPLVPWYPGLNDLIWFFTGFAIGLAIAWVYATTVLFHSRPF